MQQEERTVCFDKDLKIEAYCFKGIKQKFPNHFHEHYVIGFIESGTRRLLCKNRDYNVGSGDLLLFNPMDNHSCEQIDDKTLDYRCINISPQIMRRAAQEVTGEEYLPQFTQPAAFNSEQVYLLKELHQAIMEQQSNFKKEETFLFLIENLIEEFTGAPDKAKPENVNIKIDAVCGYIDKHFCERITLDELSLLSKMNKYTLLRAFTKIRGITPYRYMETVRINEAKKHLEKGVTPIDAAMQTGFVDQSHFTNYFKECIGLTPKQYQKIFTVDGVDVRL